MKNKDQETVLIEVIYQLPILKNICKIILESLHLLYMGEEVKIKKDVYPRSYDLYLQWKGTK